MSGLEQMVADYLRVRRSLGFKLDEAEYILARFVNHVQTAGGPQTVTVAHALAFATAPAGASHRWQALRLSAIRCFARWAQTVDPTIEVPPTRLLPARPTRTAPYIYSDAEIGALLDAAARLRPAIRAATHHTLIALMATTGIRTGEAIGLDIASLDPQAGTLDRDRQVRQDTHAPAAPEHRSCADAVPAAAQRGAARGGLSGAADLYPRYQVVPQHRSPDLPAAHRRGRATHASSACRPRPHDLRHTFAVSTMLDAYTRGADPAAVLPLLATWLGHCEPSDTYWYLTGTAELLAAATERVAGRHDDQQGDGA